MAKQRVKVPVAATDATSQSNQSQPPAQEHKEKIAQLAYDLWQARGCPHGSPEEDWFAAEQEKIVADSPCGRRG